MILLLQSPSLETMETRNDDVIRGSPSREGKKENETTQKRGCYEEDKMCSICAGEEGRMDTVSCRVKVRGIKTEEGVGAGRRHGSKQRNRNKETGGVLSDGGWCGNARQGLKLTNVDIHA